MSKTKSVKNSKAEINAREFPSIKVAFEALDSLQEKINDIKTQFEIWEDSDGAWKKEDNFGDFVESEIDGDREFFRKLVNLGLIVS